MILLYSGDSPTSNEGGILSAGDEKYERILWLRVRVFDNIGSWTDIFINATVEAPPDELVLASSSCMFANEIFYLVDRKPIFPNLLVGTSIIFALLQPSFCNNE